MGMHPQINESALNRRNGCDAMSDSDQSCIPEPQDWEFLRADDAYYINEQGIKKKAAQVITVTGQAGCRVNAVGMWGTSFAPCDDVHALISDFSLASWEHVDKGKIVAATLALATAAVELLSPILPRCAVATTLNPIQSPDQDEAEGWRLAVDAIVWTYSGSFNQVRAGQRVDVKYPSGDAVRFLIWDVTRDPVPAFRQVSIRPFLDGIPNPSNARC